MVKERNGPSSQQRERVPGPVAPYTLCPGAGWVAGGTVSSSSSQGLDVKGPRPPALWRWEKQVEGGRDARSELSSRGAATPRNHQWSQGRPPPCAGELYNGIGPGPGAPRSVDRFLGG